jgi:hypothetical protein
MQKDKMTFHNNVYDVHVGQKPATPNANPLCFIITNREPNDKIL